MQPASERHGNPRCLDWVPLRCDETRTAGLVSRQCRQKLPEHASVCRGPLRISRCPRGVSISRGLHQNRACCTYTSTWLANAEIPQPPLPTRPRPRGKFWTQGVSTAIGTSREKKTKHGIPEGQKDPSTGRPKWFVRHFTCRAVLHTRHLHPALCHDLPIWLARNNKAQHSPSDNDGIVLTFDKASDG